MITVNKENVQTVPLNHLAIITRRNWEKPYFGAVPYLDAMYCLDSINDSYGADTGKQIVAYFLSNASTWRGDVARMVKAELNRRLKL